MAKRDEEYQWDLSEIPDKVIIAEAGRRRQKLARPKPKVMHDCKYCGKPFGAKEVRQHWPKCPKNPKRLKAKTAK